LHIFTNSFYLIHEKVRKMTKISFKTIKEPASGSLVERKSEFIGYATPVKTEEDAIGFVNEIRKKHSDARHNVYAYILRENNTVRFSDDGEPHGTAGMPVLDVLRKEELTDIAVVVTRYFGGKIGRAHV
jgi:putative IMPACT (imprinted ancient) family translation regulator